jgi:hypothetical protein
MIIIDQTTSLDVMINIIPLLIKLSETVICEYINQRIEAIAESDTYDEIEVDSSSIPSSCCMTIKLTDFMSICKSFKDHPNILEMLNRLEVEFLPSCVLSSLIKNKKEKASS